MPTAHKIGDLTFYLVAKEVNTLTWSAPQLVSITADTDDSTDPATTSTKKGKVVINLTKANYDFELYAVKTANVADGGYASRDTVKAASCLWATAQADLRYGDPVSFTLTSEGLSKNGNVKLKLYAVGWDPTKFEGYDVSAQLTYSKTTVVDSTTYTEGSALASSTVKLVDASSDATIKVSTGISATSPTTANYEKSGVAPGTYNFEVLFSKNGKTYVWSDRIVVLSDEDTVAEVAITPTIDIEPSAPKDFKAAYIDNEKSGYYQVEFTWDGSEITNETHFELEWLKVPASVSDALAVQPFGNDAASLITAATAWDNLKSVTGAESKTYGTDFVGNINVYSAGSLGKNNSVAIFKAAYGQRYAARIRAVNDRGNSAWTYVTLTDDIAASTTTGAIAATKFVSKLINRYKITYNVSGGTLTPADTKTTYISSQVFVTETTSDTATNWFKLKSDGTKQYYTYANGVNIMQPDGNTDYLYDPADSTKKVEKPKLSLDSKEWTNWTNKGGNWNEIGSYVAPYGGFEDLNLVANFATIGTVTIFDDNDYAIAGITTTATGDAALTQAGSNKTHYYTVLSQTTNKDGVDWAVTYPTDVAYDKVTLRLYPTMQGSSYYDVDYDSTNKKFTLKPNEYKTGTYRAEICAYTAVKPDDPYTAQISVIIKD